MRILNGYAQVVSLHVFFNAYNLHLLVCVSGLEFQASNKKDLYCAQVICNTYMYMYCMFSFCDPYACTYTCTCVGRVG